MKSNKIVKYHLKTLFNYGKSYIIVEKDIQFNKNYSYIKYYIKLILTRGKQNGGLGVNLSTK
ncbi:hypothetical protein Z962_03800 [Clostridium botulinum C/D str. BKT12695]|nr:hypothetical protein Z962_03800 [Clostridium botulinum C/D str. BKT12695]